MSDAPVYKSLGVSASKAGLHEALCRAGVAEKQAAFCSLEPDIAGDPSFYFFMHCDGCGTKSIVSYLQFREKNDINAFSGLAQDALVMNLDDVFCLGTPQSLHLVNIINRNARLIPDDVLGLIISEYHALAKQLEEQGVGIVVSGGESADCGDIVRTLVVDAIIAGRIERNRLINLERITPGDLIIGLPSSGQAGYEKKINSGIGSNGLTLARHALLSSLYAERYPEISDPCAEARAVTGLHLLTDVLPGTEMTLAEALCSPTRCFAPVLKEIYARLGAEIHGAIHVTGGGLSKVLRFGRANHYIKDNLFPVPPVFSFIQQAGNISWSEMYQVFNMGQLFELFVPEKCYTPLYDILRGFNLEARVIGRVEKSPLGGRNKVTLKTPQGVFDYVL